MDVSTFFVWSITEMASHLMPAGHTRDQKKKKKEEKQNGRLVTTKAADDLKQIHGSPARSRKAANRLAGGRRKADNPIFFGEFDRQSRK